MPDPGSLVPVLRMRCIEAELQAKRLVLGLFIQEFDGPVTQNLSLVTFTPIFLLFEVGIATQFAADVEHGCCGFIRKRDMFFAKVSGPITRFFQHAEVRSSA